MFGHPSLPSKIVRLGASPPQGADSACVREQMWLAHRYQNRLIELERDRRIKVRELLAAQPEVSDAQAAIEEIQKKLKVLEPPDAESDTPTERIKVTGTLPQALSDIARANSHARSRRGASPELRAQAKALREELKKAAAKAKEIRKAAYAQLRPELDAIEADAGNAKRAARAASGLYSGTYLEAESAAQGARKANDLPRFKRWDGDGKAGAQIQGGISLAEALAGTDTRLRVELLPKTGREQMALVRIRVGSRGAGGREPIWSEHIVNWHYPIPEYAIIKWAYVLRRRVGQTDHWYVLLTISSASGFLRPDAAPVEGSGSMALRLGWASTPAGLRVASWSASDGRNGDLILPADIVKELADCDGIKAVRDIRRDMALATLRAWLVAGPIPDGIAPDLSYLRTRRAGEMKRAAGASLDARIAATESLISGWPSAVPASDAWKEKLLFLPKWKSSSRLSDFVYWLRTNRIAGDEALFGWLEEWRKHDKHLRNYESHRRLKFAHRRKEIYRLFAVDARRRYGKCEIADLNLAKMMRRPKQEDPDRINKAARWNQRAASPGLLKGIMLEMGPASTAVVEAPAKAARVA